MIGKFWEGLARLKEGSRVLECGTATPPNKRSAVLRHAPGARRVGTDMVAGDDVDVVCDLHELSSRFGPEFDAILCTSVLEHVLRPWVVAEQLARVAAPGCLLYVQTHQSFPLHDYPGDYFRFSADALQVLFCAGVGWRCLDAGHEYPAKVIPLGNELAHARDWNFGAEAYLNSWILCERVP